MAADVQERSEYLVPVADEDDGDVADSRRRELSGLGDVAQVADVLPRAAEDSLALELEDRRIRVPAPRKAPHVDRAHGHGG
jgi:hypothetical protein